jgi:hypothetical protein
MLVEGTSKDEIRREVLEIRSSHAKSSGYLTYPPYPWHGCILIFSLYPCILLVLCIPHACVPVLRIHFPAAHCCVWLQLSQEAERCQHPMLWVNLRQVCVGFISWSISTWRLLQRVFDVFSMCFSIVMYTTCMTFHPWLACKEIVSACPKFNPNPDSKPHIWPTPLDPPHSNGVQPKHLSQKLNKKMHALTIRSTETVHLIYD